MCLVPGLTPEEVVGRYRVGTGVFRTSGLLVRPFRTLPDTLGGGVVPSADTPHGGFGEDVRERCDGIDTDKITPVPR